MTDQKTFSIPLMRHLLIIIITILLLYWGKSLFVPLLYGLFIAIVLFPFCRWLEHRGFSKTFAVTIGLFIVLILMIVLIALLILQLNALREDLPGLKVKAAPALNELQLWINDNFNIPVTTQKEWIGNTFDKLSGQSGSWLAGSLSQLTSGLFMLFIVPVFAALFLYNRKDFVLFAEKCAGTRYRERLYRVLHSTIHTYFHFIKGMIFVYIIVGALNSIGLLVLGIRHAVLFGFLTAVMTIIPYAGIFISALLPITVAWITKDSIWYPVGVVSVFAFVQYLEANVIFPRIVASQLNVSTWATLVAILAGGIIWGVSGMILFIPFVAILKMVTDYFPEWEALNVLLRRTQKKNKPVLERKNVPA